MTHVQTGIGGVETWTAPPNGRLVVAFSRRGPKRDARTAASVESRWAELTAANPRMFNGPLLSVVGADLGSGQIECARDDFKHLAVQDRVRTGVEILAVSGVLMARDGAGREHVLVGRRAHQTRVYGGMWELGPSGGMPLPGEGVHELSLTDFAAHLAEETREEAGIEIDGSACACVGFCRDLVAHSLDVMIRVDLREPLETIVAHAHDWEYEEVRWIGLTEVAEFDRRFADQVIAPTRAFFRSLGWVRDTRS